MRPVGENSVLQLANTSETMAFPLKLRIFTKRVIRHEGNREIRTLGRNRVNSRTLIMYDHNLRWNLAAKTNSLFATHP